MPPLFDTLDFFDDREPRPAAMNMAIDQALLENLRAPALRIYRWALPAVSFGYFEKYEPVRAAYPERELVRRWTGGGIVPHGGDFTYTLLIPAAAAFYKNNARESYRAIHGRLAAALKIAGVAVSISSSNAGNISRACFENPVEHDVMLEGKKIAGAAQRRTRGGLLHQGSIQNLILPENFARCFAATFSEKIRDRASVDLPLRDAEKIAVSRYLSEAWMRKF